jgi:hypothetical protein
MIFKVLAAMGKKGLYEEIPLLLIVRALLGLAIVLFPLALLFELLNGHLHAIAAEVGASIWVMLILVALKWRRVIVFSLPGELLILASEALDDVAPRALRPSEVLKMSVEDNVGDPEPAAKTFEYVPETFEQGLARIIR